MRVHKRVSEPHRPYDLEWGCDGLSPTRLAATPASAVSSVTLRLVLPAMVRDFFGRGFVFFPLNLPVMLPPDFKSAMTSTRQGEFQSEL